MTTRPLPAEEAWRTLAARAIEPNPFFTPAVLAAALQAFGDSRIKVATAFDDVGRLSALAPVHRVRLGRVAPAIAVWTHLYGPLGTPLIDRDNVDTSIAALVAAMEGERAGRNILLFPDLPLDGAVAAALRRHAGAAGRPVAIVGGHERAVLPCPSSFDVRGALPPKTRKELGRQLRRLNEIGPVSFSTASTIEALAEALEAFLRLEQAGWKGTRGTALALRPDALAFVRSVIAGAAAGAVRIDALAVGGSPVATLVSLRSQGTLVTWKIAYDETLARFSPGVQLMLAASESFAGEPALALVDSLASADHPMIDRLWPARQSVGTFTMGPDRGGAPLAAGLLLARTEAKARAKLRVLIRRRPSPTKAKEETA